MKNVALVTIGNELLAGKIINSNATFLARKFSEYGFRVTSILSIADDREMIQHEVGRLLHGNDLVVVSGGLGPTDDDITVESVAGLLNKKMVLDEKIVAKVQSLFRARNIPMTRENEKQAMIIEGATVITNTEGLAPGSLTTTQDGKQLLLLPAVPRELRSIVSSDEAKSVLGVSPGHESVITFKIFKVLGISESRINELIRASLARARDVEFGSYPQDDSIHIHLTGKGTGAGECRERYKVLIESIRTILKNNIYAEDDETIESLVVDNLAAGKKSIFVVEGYTGGLVSYNLAKMPGSTCCYRGGMIIYNTALTGDLGISREEYEAHGAASESFAKKAAMHIKAKEGVDLCLCVSEQEAAAGPAKDYPAGTAYVALATDTGVFANKFVATGKREMAQKRTALFALHMVNLYCTNKPVAIAIQ